MGEPAVLRVLQIGPGLEVRGGVSAVERLICDHLGPRVDVRHIATMEDGSISHRVGVFLRGARALKRELTSSRPSVVHIHFASRGSTLRKLLLARMVMRAGRPLILHAHGAGFDTFFTRLARPLQSMVRGVLSRADRFVVLSSQWRSFYIEKCAVQPKRVTIMHNPVELPAELPDRSGRRYVQFLFLGRIGTRKGAFDILQAYGALAPDLRVRARLVFAGDGDVEGLRQKAAAYGDSVKVFSWIDAKRRETLLRESDVLVLPSRAEGVPMAVLEAMAFGLPSIVSPVGGIPDVVRDKVEGLFVSPGNPQQLSRAMAGLILDERQRLTLGTAARRRAQDFDINRYTGSLLQLYRQVSEEKG